MAQTGRSRRSSSFQSNLASLALKNDDANDESYGLQLAEIERLPTFDRLKLSLFDKDDDMGRQVIDVTKLGALERHEFIEKLIKHVQNDNLLLLQRIRQRIDRVGVELPSIEVRYKHVCVEAECEVVHGKPLPTIWNSIQTTLLEFGRLFGSKPSRANINVINDVSGIIKPGRITLLLGPPGSGKTTLLKALSGNLDKSMKVTGEVSYNGYKLEEFVPQKTSAYVSQYDQHISHMTVRETLDFSARCQGVGSKEEIMLEVIRREKEAGIAPDPDIDTYMKATSVRGLKRTLQTDYILKILGLEICADTLVGDAMKRGISGGQKKKLTTGEMIIGPAKALFMDEITNGLDSSTTFHIISCFKQLAHTTDATLLVSILQPAPETFELFDDIVLMAEGKIAYHGPHNYVLNFFEDCGFRCPERKGIAEFLQEVISKKDQAQYWYQTELPYNYFSVDMFARKFKESPLGKKLDEELLVPYDKSKSHTNALSFSAYSVSKWDLFRACMSRELLLIKRNSFVYIFKLSQVAFLAFITMTVFWHARNGTDAPHAIYYMGSLFFALNLLLVNGYPEVPMTIARLPLFCKHRELRFYPAWAYAIPASILKLPFSFLESFVWTSITYYVIGYSPEFWRFFRQLILLCAVHVASSSMFRFLASVFPTDASSMAACHIVLISVLTFAGFIITRPSMPIWLKWGFWVSPLSYGEIGLSINEFLAPRWQKTLSTSTTTTIGQETLESRGLNFSEDLYWISLVALLGFTLIFGIGFILVLTFLNYSRSSRAIVSHEKFFQIQKSDNGARMEEKSRNSLPSSKNKCSTGRMALPYAPLTIAFQDVQYFVDTPLEMRKKGFTQRKLQLLSNIMGAFRPGVLTALMGVTGAGKTTLLDVLAGRKTSGYVEGEIKVGGYPKVQQTFARISGYCEQTDIHSPQITVEESLIFSASLRLAPQIDSKTIELFVNEVLETIELDGIKDALVGMPGVNGLSIEQRKRLTIAVELVANPFIIFMDEPTTGLDARAAAIVMRAVKNVADTGRTIVCTIHQPSTEVFEAFDELILLKKGGHIIYSGPVGQHSSRVIQYFEGVSGVPNITTNYNPATWMLEVTSPSSEAEFGIDFAQIYKDSTSYEYNKALVRELSTPPPGTRDLKFPTRFAQNGWRQFKFCLWKQHLSYWRNPSYNLSRVMRVVIGSLIFGLLFWDKGNNINNQQDLLNVFGSMYVSAIFLGIINCSSIAPSVSTERIVMYRERFSGMYSSWAYALAQVTIEVPYIFIQTIIFLVITYPMIGYSASVSKVFWFFVAMFFTILYFLYFGMLMISLTPTIAVSSILSNAFYTLFNLFAGFLIPKQQIPKWWIWLYYLMPTSWTLNVLLTSQYRDIDKDIVVFGETKKLTTFLEDYFGYHHNQLVVSTLVLVLYPLVLASLFIYFIGRLNFQRR